MALESHGEAAVNADASAASSPPVPKPVVTPEDEIRAVARKFSDQPVQNPDPGVWAVLTAISKNARQRPQVPYRYRHYIGTLVRTGKLNLGYAISELVLTKVVRVPLLSKEGKERGNKVTLDIDNSIGVK
ncbi:hypothetical protein GW17_00021123 [Ensete ventricosum]|nr:hypothetical protein GW17_00021123 [Ensete ventricosum]RZR90515.1 hypothetical protein BHM03_00018407 [Ensete ventricosum]